MAKPTAKTVAASFAPTEEGSPPATPRDIADKVWGDLITVEALTSLLYDGLNSYENHHACGRDDACVQFSRLRIAAGILLERVRAVTQMSDGLLGSITEVPHG